MSKQPSDAGPAKDAPPSAPPPPAGGTHAAHSFRAKAWTFLRMLNVRLRFIVIMVLIGVVVGNWESIMNHYDRWRRPARAPGAVEAPAHEIEYYCPMHPNIIQAQPGNCPICGMPLAERLHSVQVPLGEGVLGQVQLTPQKMIMGRIGTTPVEYRLLAREVRALGLVDYDETRRATITARVKGRLDKLLVNYTGQTVKQGEPMAMMYSPDLMVAQEELLAAVKAQPTQPAPADLAAEMDRSLVESARRKLLLWGLSTEQVDGIVQRGQVDTHVPILSPISGIVTEKKALEGQYVMEGQELYTVADLSVVWLQAKIYESDIGEITTGTAVEVTSTAYPQEVFAGRIEFVAYSVEESTRTVAARVRVDNPGEKLKPGMYVSAVIRLPLGTVTMLDDETAPAPAPQQDARSAVGYYCPIYPDRVFETAGHCPIDKFPLKMARVEKVLTVPASAIIDTGTRKIAYRQSSPGVFDLIEVHLGPRAGEFYPVASGLDEGELVATAGAFLVDAENRLNPAASAQYFGASGGPQGGQAEPAGMQHH